MEAFLLSAGVIFVAELGDKSQLMAMAFAARYRFWPVIIGITGATLLVHAGSVLIGRFAAAALPVDAINLAAGAAYLGFAVWTLRGDELGDEDQARATRVAPRTIARFAAASFVIFGLLLAYEGARGLLGL